MADLSPLWRGDTFLTIEKKKSEKDNLNLWKFKKYFAWQSIMKPKKESEEMGMW